MNNENADISIYIDESEQENEIHSAVKYRKIATDNLLFQAKRMVERSKKLVPPLKEGNNAFVGVSQFD